MLFTPENSALVIVDIQEKLVPAIHQSDKLVKNAAIMVQIANALEMPVFWLEQYPEKLGPTSPEIATHLTHMKPVAKKAFSGYHEANCVQRFDSIQRERVYIVGMETHVCVFQTFMDLLGAGVAVKLVVDAISSRSPENKSIALDEMHNLGAGFTTVEMAMFELLRTARHEKFRELQKLIK
jgi:nicotinamidase-related amidase